jgi:hypothetical protein
MSKRKHESAGAESNGSSKKTAKSENDQVHANFGDKLFDQNVVAKYRDDYAQSGPYVSFSYMPDLSDTAQVISTQSCPA